MKWLSLVCLLSLLGCSSYLTPPEATTSLREYSINDLHVVVGVGEWSDNTFIIHSFDGQQWDVPKGVPVYESAVTLESFKRVTK